MLEPGHQRLQSTQLMRSIDHFDLRSFDLNLLIAFDALISPLCRVIGLSHRAIVLNRGRLQGTLKHGDATNVAIMGLATR
jgi:hypothetical protein